MLIVNNSQITNHSPVFSYLPRRISRQLDFVSETGLEEIRLRCGLPLSLCYSHGIRYVDSHGTVTDDIRRGVCVQRSDIDEGMERITSSSVYAAENTIKNGFITIKGGHRVGICGQCVVKDGAVSYINGVSGLNYRIARQIKGAADTVVDSVCTNGRIRSTLIVGAPNSGKTTMLRDLVRCLSECGHKVSVVDERSEISGMYDGRVYYDLGPNTDVLDGSSKADGIMMMLRSMSPDVIAADEIGGADDMRAVEAAALRGVSVITTVHAATDRQLMANPSVSLSLFECIVFIGRRCSVREVRLL